MLLGSIDDAESEASGEWFSTLIPQEGLSDSPQIA